MCSTLGFIWPMADQCIQWLERSKRNRLVLSTNVLGQLGDHLLWVARMIMHGYEWRGEKPFQAVYFTGMVGISKAVR